MKYNRDIKKIQFKGKSIKIRSTQRVPFVLYPAYYDLGNSTIYICPTLSDKEWYEAMIHEIQEVLLHEFFDSVVAQLTAEEKENH